MVSGMRARWRWTPTRAGMASSIVARRASRLPDAAVASPGGETLPRLVGRAEQGGGGGSGGRGARRARLHRLAEHQRQQPERELLDDPSPVVVAEHRGPVEEGDLRELAVGACVERRLQGSGEAVERVLDADDLAGHALDEALLGLDEHR